jgi:hypothetical protein
MYDNPPPAGIRVITKFSPLAFLFYFARTRLHLDGGLAVDRPWGETAIPVQPGRHQVRCYCRWLFWRAMGDAAIVVDVPPGQLVNLVWRPPWLPFQAGQWTVLGVQDLTAPVATEAPNAVEPAEEAVGEAPEAPPEPQREPQPEVEPEIETVPERHLQPVTQQQPVPPTVKVAAVPPEPAVVPTQLQPSVGSPVQPEALPIAGWYPDPAQRHQYRYWDGREWAPHVADNGVITADSL